MGNTTLKKMLAIIINLSIVIMEIIAFAICYQKDGLSCFQYYTQDSNLFLMVTSFIFLIYETINLKTKEEIPHWVSILKYSATTCVTTTFLVVVTVLAPIRWNDALSPSYLSNTCICIIYIFRKS